jgi:adenine deaminase
VILDIEEFIRTIPKAELHLHIEGTLEPELKFALAARNGIELPYPSVDEMRAAYDFDDLTSFLEQYYEGMLVLCREADFYDLAMAYFARVAAQGLVYVEMFFDPQAHTNRGIAFETVVSGLRRAQQDAVDRFGIRSQLIMCFLRDLSVESAFETLTQAAKHRDWIVGVGLDSDEQGNPPEKFREVFVAAREQGYRLTMHCDIDQADSVAHIWQCLDIGVDRIDHGVNALEHDALVEEIKRRGLGLTTCPISNSHVAGGTKAHQIRTLLERGVLVTVNSDDPAYFPGYVADNLLTLAREARLTREDVARIVRNGFVASWLSGPDRRAYLDELDAWVRGVDELVTSD